MDDDRGLIWPLALFFLVALCGGIIGLVYPSPFGGERYFGLLLCGAALAVAVLLYFPRFWNSMRVPDLTTLDRKIDALQARFDKIDGLLDAGGDLRKETGAIQGRFDEARDRIAEVRKRAEEIKDQLDAELTKLDKIVTHLDSGGEVRTLLEDIKAK
jgi:hypothetical protein